MRVFIAGEKESPVMAASLADWLKDFVAAVERGDYVEDPERGDFLKSGS